jgi:hypothetical protein
MDGIDHAFEIFFASEGEEGEATVQRPAFHAGARASLLILTNRLALRRPQTPQEVGEILAGLISELT